MAGTLVREEFSSSVLPPRSKGGTRGKTRSRMDGAGGNCRELLQHRFFIGPKDGFAPRGGIMSRGVQCIMESKECGQKAFPFFRISMQIRLFTDDDGEKEMDEEGVFVEERGWMIMV